MIGSYAVAVSAIHLIARTAAFVSILITVLVRGAVVVREAFYFETA